MAITLNHSPNYYIRAYDTNTTYYKISSTQSSQTNFRFVVKLYGPTGTYLSTVKLLADSSGYGYYNPTSYINNFLTSDININTNLPYKCTNSIGTYRLDFAEEYGDPVVEYTGTTTSSKVYYNGCQIYEDYDLVSGQTYWVIADNSTNGHCLTPTNKFYLDPREKAWLYFITSGSTPFTLEYEFDGGSSSESITITPTAGTMLHVGFGPANLPTGSTPANWTYYKINMYNISQDYLGTNYIYVYKKAKCDYNDWTEVYWLNEHGGWSNFVFNKRKYKEYKIGRSTYDKFLNYGYTVGSRGQSQYLTTIDQTIVVNSDWINDSQNLLIKSLLFSPDVRVLENGILIPYIILDSEYQEKNSRDDGLYSYAIKMTPANKKVIQRG